MALMRPRRCAVDARDAPPAGRVEERYRSAVAPREAAGVLHGLATVLLQVRGAFAEDATVDADQLRALAESLTSWWPHLPASAVGDRAGGHGLPDEQHWAALLQVYFRAGLSADPTTSTGVDRNAPGR
jgi:hypothetical protein